MTARISCTPDTKDALSNFSSAGDVSYEELLRFMMKKAGIKYSHDPLVMRAQALKFYEELQSFKDELKEGD